MLNLCNGSVMTNNRKLQVLFETKLSIDDKVPKTGRILRNKIFVIGFPPCCTEIDLENFFSNFGLVREVRIVKDENGVTKGYAFITFAKERSVKNALEHREPLYFMDRKLSINPAVKKQHQLVQKDRCLSLSTSLNTPSDTATSLTIDISHDLNSLMNTGIFPVIPIPIASQTHTRIAQHYCHTTSQPYFHFNLSPHPIYCTSGPSSIWQHYFSTLTSYPVGIKKD